MDDNELVSVIVPIFNVEKYLKRCIESIINQTYKNIEVILVDDGSTDSSGKICEEYTSDYRVKIIHKKNGGLSDARNAGIENARGKYLVFIDSDDFIESDMIEKLYINIKSNNVKIAVCGVYLVTKNQKKKYQKKYVKEMLDKKQALLKLIDERTDFRVWATNKMYLAELFKNIRYPVGKIYEDVGTTYKVVDLVDKIVYIGEPKYNYCIREDSITGSETFNKKELQRIEMCEEMCNYIINKYPDLQNEYNFFRITQYIAVINVMIKSKKKDIKIIKKCKQTIKKNLKQILISKMSFEKKVQIILLLISYPIYEKIYLKKVNK